MDDYKNNEYEILNVQNDLRLLRRIRPLCLQKAKDMCKFLTKILINWFVGILIQMKMKLKYILKIAILKKQ